MLRLPLDRTRTAAKCTKMENACTKLVRILFFLLLNMQILLMCYLYCRGDVSVNFLSRVITAASGEAS